MTIKTGFIISVATLFLAGLFVQPARGQQGWTKLQSIKQGGKGAVINAVYYDGDDIWVAGAQGLLARSYDEGRTFQEVDSG